MVPVQVVSGCLNRPLIAGARLVVVAPRLVLPLAGAPDAPLRNLFTGEQVQPQEGMLPLAGVAPRSGGGAAAAR